MKSLLSLLTILFSLNLSAQKIERVHLNPSDTTTDSYIAVIPEGRPIKGFMFLLDGFGASPKDVLAQTALPRYAAQQGILTIIPILKTGPLYFGSDNASQQSLRQQIEQVIGKYQVQGKPFYIGGFSIGGTCALKYAQLAVQNNYAIKPKAVFAGDSPLDWERFYNSAKRVVRLSNPAQVDGEVTYMIDRIEKEMGGTPQTAIKSFYALSPYSYSDTTQTAVKLLRQIPVMLITEPDIQWWLKNRGYDLDYLNLPDQVAMINELQRLGNGKAVLVTTTNKGYRKPQNKRHPHSWSIAEPTPLVKWLLEQK